MVEDVDPRTMTHRRADQDAGCAVGPAGPGLDDERLLDLLEQWEERFRRDEGAEPESLGVEDPALLEALRERIERQKRLYAFLKLSSSEEVVAGGGPSEGPPGGNRDAPAEADRRPGSGPTSTDIDIMSIGRFRVLRVLGKGGFGRVYLAYDPDLQRHVAIKLPIAGQASRFLDVEAYLREARMVARLSHPNIVPVYDVGHTDDGRGYVVSKYMEGGDLKSRLERGRPSFAESAEMLAVLCDALQYTHTQDLFHRDIKPGNILLDAAGVPSLADFGLALRDEEVGRGADYLGTAAYMSPEQARGEGHRVDGRSDIFSLGVVLYEMLVGRRPFRGRSPLEIMEQVVHAEPRPPRQIDGTIPGELERICLKALAKRASERYTTARDLAEDLRHFLSTVSWACPTSEPPPVVASPREPTRAAAPEEPDSNSRPIRIVPKGLGSFDEQDADFFLELLPGPRDRDGLPDGLRFWKTRIETTDPDRACRVGLIYGPSGCGKSSLVKAGLLPRLGPQVCSIYVESTGDDTEARLLRSLRRLFPALPADAGLVEGLKVIRCGHGLPAGRKVLLVLDQFEQWLFARRGERASELVAALRQCDGEHVQALCLVRDDFWMAATRLMKELDIELNPERNVAAVDLFERRHARKVLAAYGRAYEALPPRPTDLSRDQESFLDQAVAGLAQDGRVVPVRLALFAEMVKGRPWTPATLREVGGMDGVGLKFLEDAFSSARALPNHRYHQRASRAVLKALLPETNADIKGRMQSIEELRDVSGYAGRPADFAELIRMLDGELRLITPVDPEGSVEEEAPASEPGGRYFQLTHDYLVHALREWLTRKQRETRRGRAELLLAERAAMWDSRPEDRYLPSAREWAVTLLLTKRKDWSEPQRRMMQRAGRIIGLRSACGALVVAGLSFAGLGLWHHVTESNRAAHTRALVRGLRNADTRDVAPFIREIPGYAKWAVPELRRVVSESPDDSKPRLHASLALRSVDGDQVDYLYQQLLAAGPAEMAVIRDSLQPNNAMLTGRLWQELRAARPGDARVLPVAASLARYTPGDAGWNEVGDKVAGAMTQATVGEFEDWREAMRGIRTVLIGPLTTILRDPQRRGEHVFAASLLADYAADRPELLVDRLLDAAPRPYSALFPAVQNRGADCLAGLREAVKSALPDPTIKDIPSGPAAGAGGPGMTTEQIEDDRDRLASRGARAAVALAKLGHADEVWRLLEYNPAPRSRSAFIHALSAYDVDPALLAAELGRLAPVQSKVDPNDEKNAYLFDAATSRRRALILALAGYPKEALDDRARGPLVDGLARAFREDPDAGVHSAAELALRRWGHQDRLKLEPGRAPRIDGPYSRRWYVNPEGQTMVFVDGPVLFNMGSPPSDPDHEEGEIYHSRRIPRRFFISSKEVTIDEFERYAMARLGGPREYSQRFSAGPNGPAIGLNWYEAAAYCNWLSDREGLPRCYRPNKDGKFEEGMSVDAAAVAAGGYRLPTEAEWEYTCRAGTITDRHYGRTIELLGAYEWYSRARTHPCGWLLPNDLGLFDMLGNAFEWCHDLYLRPEEERVLPSLRIDSIEDEKISKEPRYIHAGSCRAQPDAVRSAARGALNAFAKHFDIGLRPARTCP